MALSRVVVKSQDQILYDEQLNWAGGFWQLPYDRKGTTFNPKVGTENGQIIYFYGAGGTEIAVGVTLKIPDPF